MCNEEAEMSKRQAALTHPCPAGSDADNEVTAFPRGSSDLAPHQHVSPSLAESRFIWDPHRRGMLLLLFLSRRKENEASHGPLSATLTPDILLQSDNLLHTLQSKCYGGLTEAKLDSGQVTSRFEHFCI